MLAGGVSDPAQLQPGDLRLVMPRFMGQAFQANLKLFTAFAALAREAGCTPAQLCLAWLLARDPIVVPIPGTTNPAHMRENAAAADLQLATDVVARIDELLNPATVTVGRYASTAGAGVETEMFPVEP
mgnify:FL=1